MWMVLVTLLAQQSPQPALKPSQQWSPDTAGAYVDAAARDVVRRARERRGAVDAAISSYETVVKERVSLGLKAMRRDRLMLGQDEVARISWHRDGPTRVDIIGARQATPMFKRGFSLPDDLKDVGSVVFEPTDDRLRLGFIDSSFVRHPLGEGSEAYYRFASGDTTTIRLPDGKTLTLLEIRILPRRDDVHLLRGSIWIDAATSGMVRGLFRLAADFDLEKDADPDDKDDLKDVPGVLKPIKASLRFLTIEYGLVGYRWWMPRLVAVEGTGQVGAMASFPVRYERTYSDYEVQGDSVATRLAAAPDPRHVRPENCRDTPKGRTCDCHQSDCRIFDVHLPADTMSLLTSAELPPPPASAYDELVTEDQLKDIADRLGILPRQPWKAAVPTLHWGLGRAGLARFNRVEGLSLGARTDFDFGPLTADLTGRLGVAPAPADSPRAIRLTPDVVARVTRNGFRSSYRVSGYRRTDVMDPAGRGLGFGNSFNALVFGRDDGDYFHALGADLTRHAAPGTDEHVVWRLFAERQTPANVNTQWSLRRLFGSGPTFRPNLQAQRADEAGAELALRWSHGLEASSVRYGASLGLDGATGTFDYARPSAAVQLGLPLPFGLVGSAEAAAGTSAGTVPLQRSWFLGGPATLRGYDGAQMWGDSFWRGRAELATALPAARLALFGDAGWAGSRHGWRAGRPLYSAGVGASFLDGYIRVDLARALRAPTGWRLDVYLDGLL